MRKRMPPRRARSDSSSVQTSSRAPAPISAGSDDEDKKEQPFTFPAIGLPGENVVYKPFGEEDPSEDA